MTTDYPGWLSRAQRNPKGVGTILYVPADVSLDLRYETGLNLAMREIQAYYWRQCGKTFRRFSVATVPGKLTKAEFELLGMKEATEAIISGAAAAYRYVGGRLPSTADPDRVWVSCLAAPKGFVGGTIGIDNYRPASDASIITTWPWPGRTGLMGKGLEIIAQRPVTYETTPDNDPNTYRHEDFADQASEWMGAIAHELGHCFCGLLHPDWAKFSLMNAWWSFLAYPACPLLPEEVIALQASPFLR